MIVINTGFAATAHLLAETKQQQADTEDDYDNDDYIDGQQDDDTAAISRINGTNSYNQVSPQERRQPSLLSEEYVRFDEDTEAACLNKLELMPSFDEPLEDIDLTSPIRNNQSTKAMIFTTDEEMARKMQAKEFELARMKREAALKKHEAQQQLAPLRKLKKSWLDNLIGEPFPQELRRNYYTPNNCQSGCSSGLMAAIAAADARVTAFALESSILVDNSNDAAIAPISSRWWST